MVICRRSVQTAGKNETQNESKKVDGGVEYTQPQNEGLLHSNSHDGHNFFVALEFHLTETTLGMPALTFVECLIYLAGSSNLRVDTG